ncbi:MAG: PilX N-terminal domain-containing pilus assembly protein [Piscinibacter sp.]
MLRRERGATTLAVTMMLLAAMLLVLVAANRNLLIELRQSANQAESTVAFEAAEAGLAWATVLLNDTTPRGDDCLAAATGASFRERHLDTASAALAPHDLRPACVLGAAGWRCGCPGCRRRRRRAGCQRWHRPGLRASTEAGAARRRAAAERDRLQPLGR